MSDPVAVTGLGLVTAAGLGVEASWESLGTGRCRAGRDESLAGLDVDISCRVPGFDGAALVGGRSSLIHDRFVQMGIVAAREAVTDAALDGYDDARIGVVMGCGLGGVATWEEQHHRLIGGGQNTVSPMLIPMLVPNMLAGHLAMDLGITGPNFVTATACASGATAIGSALDLLRSRRCDVVVTGGAEAGISRLIVSGFAQMGALSRRCSFPDQASRPFDVDRDGFVIGEGSGVLVLEREADARARGARIRARLAGYGTSADGFHMTKPHPGGRGVRAAVGMALRESGLTVADVDHVNAHGTSTPLNDRTEAGVIRDLFGDVSVTSVKGAVGHSLGAAGAIEAAVTVLTLERSVVPPTANLRRQDPGSELDVVCGAPRPQRVRTALSNSFGFGGQNAVLVFTTA